MPGSRRRVVLIAVAVLLVLDVGRSVYARLGDARPTEVWQPAPEVYADLAWPPGSDVAASASPGRRLYVRWCATCHGHDGRGNGPAAPSLIPRPRDFTRGLFKYKSTPPDQPPTDDDLARVVAGVGELPAGDLVESPMVRLVLDEPDCRADALRHRPGDLGLHGDREEAANVLHVGLPTNFKAATFADTQHNELLRELEADIDAVTLDGRDVPVKLKVFDSLFVPLAKWSMLLTGNYRCITRHEPQSIRDAVHDDLELSQSIYEHVDAIARRLGAEAKDQVPFEKYAKAAESLLKPSSAARAVSAGAPFIERVDLLVKLISHQLGMANVEIDGTVDVVDQKLNERIVAGGAGLP